MVGNKVSDACVKRHRFWWARGFFRQCLIVVLILFVTSCKALSSLKAALYVIVYAPEKFRFSVKLVLVSGRFANVKRETKETKVEVSLTVDGTGVCTANTPVHFLNHMLDVSIHSKSTM